MAPHLRMTSVLRRQRPGWYAEDDGPTSLDRPIFVHEDVPFRPELAPICAFPSLPLTYDGLGPSEAFKQEEARAQEAAAAAAAAAAGQDDVVEGAAPDDKDAMSAGTEDAMSAGTDDGDIGHEEVDTSMEDVPDDERAEDDNEDLDNEDSFEQENSGNWDVSFETESEDYGSDVDYDSDESCSCVHCERLDFQASLEGRLILKVRKKGDNDRTVNVTRSPWDDQPGNGAGQYQVKIVRRPLTPLLPPPGPGDGPLPPLEVLRQAYAKRNQPVDNQPVENQPVENQAAENEGAGHPDELNLDLSIFSDAFVHNSSDEDEDANDANGLGFNPFPDWPSLSNTMKYIIAYEFTQQGMSFVQAIRTLALSLEDSTELVNIVMAEHQKIGVIERDNDANLEFDLHLLGDYPNACDNLEDYFKLLDDNEWPQLITDYISPDEIASARAFLEFMGLNHIANRLDDYHGTGSGPYEVPLNHFVSDGPGGLLPHFNVGNAYELEDLEQALPLRLPTVPAQELLGRMDAPPGTVNPRHLLKSPRTQLHDGLGWGPPIHPNNFMMYPQSPESLEQEFQLHGVRLVLWDEWNQMDGGHAARNRAQAVDRADEGPAADEDQAMEGVADDVDERPVTPERGMARQDASSSSDEEPFVRRSVRKSRPAPGHNIGGFAAGIDDPNDDPFWNGPPAPQPAMEHDAMDIDDAPLGGDQEVENPQGLGQFLPNPPMVPFVGMDPAVSAMADKALTKAWELMGGRNDDDEEEDEDDEESGLPKFTMVTRRRLTAPSATPSAEVSIQSVKSVKSVKTVKQKEKEKANKGRAVAMVTDLDDLETSMAAQEDSEDDEWKPVAPRKKYVRKKRSPKPAPAPVPATMPRTPARKQNAQAGTSPDAPRSTIVVRAEDKNPKAARRLKSTSATSLSPAPQPAPENASFTTSSFAPPFSAVSLDASPSVKNASTAPPKTSARSTKASRPPKKMSPKPDEPKKRRGRPRKNPLPMPSAVASTPAGNTNTPANTPAGPAGFSNTPAGTSSAPFGIVNMPFGIVNTPLGNSDTPSVPTAKPLPSPAKASAPVQKPLSAFGFTSFGLGHMPRLNYDGRDKPPAIAPTTFANTFVGNRPAAPPSSLLTESELADKLERKGLLAMFQTLRGPGQSLRAVVQRIEDASGLPLDLFQKATVKKAAAKLVPPAGPAAPAAPAAPRQPAAVAPASVPAPATRKRGQSSAGAAETKRRATEKVVTPATPAAPTQETVASAPAVSLPAPTTPPSVAAPPTDPGRPATTRIKLVKWTGLRQPGPSFRVRNIPGLPRRTPTPEEEEEKHEASVEEEEVPARPTTGGKGPSFEALLRATPRVLWPREGEEEKDGKEDEEEEDGKEDEEDDEDEKEDEEVVEEDEEVVEEDEEVVEEEPEEEEPVKKPVPVERWWKAKK